MRLGPLSTTTATLFALAASLTVGLHFAGGQELPENPASPSTGSGDSLANSSTSSSANSENAPETPLAWQPGLARPVVMPSPVPSGNPQASGTPTPNTATAGGVLPPGVAGPLPGAQRLPGSGYAGPVQVADYAAGNWQLAEPASAASPASRIPTAFESGPVIPAAFQQQENSASPPQQSDSAPPATESANPNLVDAGITTVTRGMESLPNSAGQVWRTYDISPYSYNLTGVSQPEKAVVDWILKETGTEMWFAQPLGILSASGNQLHVYHTPEVQERIKPIVDRFVNSRGAARVIGLRLTTIASPDWRSTALPMMRPVPIETPGIEAWLMSKENAALLIGQLRNRADYQEHANGDLVATDGQKYVLSRTRPIEFTRSLSWVNQGPGFYQPVTDRIEEGYTVDFSALPSLDGQAMEAIIGCKIDQIEKLQTVPVNVPAPSGQNQTAQLQVPQMVSWRVNERFRWPSDQVLVLGCGVVATPGPQREALLGIPALLSGNRRRADALMFVEYKGKAAAPSTSATNTENRGAMVPVTPRR